MGSAASVLKFCTFVVVAADARRAQLELVGGRTN